ncbi:hypothetical protein BCR34DRAFT_595017 [Clohesyomyces aquaticus]|uniref:BZIP domain-containing protein n=1 Tax=Clohesyomyces aquaticus TaxID=1231657 RepID=A0A1Y1Y0H5_9PLEO|nr:hypothetical protein BCR34DRAFT_595017 [Clohesyomyces aquaticus]
MANRKYKTREERIEARRLQSQKAQERYREKKKKDAKEATDAECPESGRELPEKPSSRLKIEITFTRIKKELVDLAKFLEDTLDPSVKLYLVEQKQSIQSVIDTLHAI